MLSKDAVLEYQAVYKKVYGKEISYSKAEEQGTNLLKVFKIIYTPLPKIWLKGIKQNGTRK